LVNNPRLKNQVHVHPEANRHLHQQFSSAKQLHSSKLNATMQLFYLKAQALLIAWLYQNFLAIRQPTRPIKIQ